MNELYLDFFEIFLLFIFIYLFIQENGKFSIWICEA
jgi:hypothetical protein